MTARSTNLLDIGERTLLTAVESALAVLVTKGHLSVSVGEVAVLTGVAAALAGLQSWLLPALSVAETPTRWIEDVLARAAFSFAQTLVAALVTAAATALTLSSTKAAAIAGLAAALTTVKGVVAQRFGDPTSAGFAPPTASTAPSGQLVLPPGPVPIPQQRTADDAIAAAVVTELARRLSSSSQPVG